METFCWELEEFENERLPIIVSAAFGKMEFKSTLDLPILGSHQKLLRRNEENFRFAKMFVRVE